MFLNINFDNLDSAMIFCLIILFCNQNKYYFHRANLIYFYLVDLSFNLLKPLRFVFNSLFFYLPMRFNIWLMAARLNTVTIVISIFALHKNYAGANSWQIFNQFILFHLHPLYLQIFYYPLQPHLKILSLALLPIQENIVY